MFFSDSSDLENFSYTGSSSSDDQEELDSLFSARAQSIFSGLEESIEKIDEFLSFERGFLYGDLVCSETDPSGQMGIVVGLNMLVDLENVFGKTVQGVNSKNLRKIRTISAGDHVTNGHWVGRVDKVVDIVTVLFDDGTKTEVTEPDQQKLVTIGPNLLEDSTYAFYPGQRVQFRLSKVSASTRWICGTTKENQHIGTVISVKPGSVYIDWLASLPVNPNAKSTAPPRLQEAGNMTLLSCFPHAGWQLGDWCMMDQKNERGFSRNDLQETFNIVKTKTMVVDVMWQDGCYSFSLGSRSLLPVNVINANEFFPGQFVVEKGSFADSDGSGNRVWGVVKSVDVNEQTVKVKWKRFDTNQWKEETMSSYELVEHPDYCFGFGDIVSLLVPSCIDQADNGCVNKDTDVDGVLDLIGKDNGLGRIEYAAKSCLSTIGTVTGFKDDNVEVTWATGLKSMVAPDDIFRIEKNHNSTATGMQNEPNIELLNEVMIDPGGKGIVRSNEIYEELSNHPWVYESFVFPRSTVGFFARVTSSIFGSFGSTSLSGLLSLGNNTKDINQVRTPQVNELMDTHDHSADVQSWTPQDMDSIHRTISSQEFDEFKANEDTFSSSVEKGSEKCSQFDMVEDCSDHQFIDGFGKGLATSQMKRVWLKKVRQEWSILEKNLPETIYVRIYEERMDLIRAAIIGAPGTPYHNGLFFFDIYLPPEYPHEPPLVHYHSGGLRVNPNLYESGKICLSLLNTWTGKGTEIWNPESSSVLQVLLSLQALVLNDKPYFNEAGYEKQMGMAEAEKNSVSYNENAYLMTCKSMINILRRPPKHFEALVEEHFSANSADILLACKSYMEPGSTIESSTGFKLMLAKLLPKLVEAISDKDICCSSIV